MLSTELDDLTALLEADGPFASVAVSTPSNLADAEHRFEIRRGNVRKELAELDAPSDMIDEIDDLLVRAGHDAGESLIICRASSGEHVVEATSMPIEHDRVALDTLPRLCPIIDNRRSTIAHLVVTTDRAGADILAFDHGHFVGRDDVEGDREHIHRGHPGGWSQRRFQQRAENTWDSNARDVAEAVAAQADEHDAELVLVAGDERAIGFLLDHLPTPVKEITTVLEEGSPEAIAEATVRHTDDHVARRTRARIKAWRDGIGNGSSISGAGDTFAALREGRVEELLIRDDPDDTRRTGDDDRLVDAAVAGALRTNAEVRLVPTLPDLTDGIGAIQRW